MNHPNTAMEQESTMTTGEDHSHRTPLSVLPPTTTSTNATPQQDNDEEVSVISTTCSSVDGDESTATPPKNSTPPKPKKTLWKDKGGKARYVAGKAPQKDDANNKTPQAAVAAAAVTAGVATGAVVGLVVLGPVGLAVGGLASAGSAASAFATKRRLAFARRRQESAEKHERAEAIAEMTASSNQPPCRRFTLVHEKTGAASMMEKVNELAATLGSSTVGSSVTSNSSCSSAKC